MSDQKIRVLLIEDSLADADYTKRCLDNAERDDFEVVHKGMLQEGLQTLNSEAFHVCLLDLNLPDSTGISTIEGAIEAAPSVPIILMTGMDDEELGREAIKRGVLRELLRARFGLPRKAPSKYGNPGAFDSLFHRPQGGGGTTP